MVKMVMVEYVKWYRLLHEIRIMWKRMNRMRLRIETDS